MHYDLGKLAKKQIENGTARRIPSPSEMADMLFGKDVQDQNGKTVHMAGITEMLDYHSRTMSNYENIYIAIIRYLKILPEKLVELTNDIEGNKAYQKELRDIELKKIYEAQEKAKKEAAK